MRDLFSIRDVPDEVHVKAKDSQFLQRKKLEPSALISSYRIVTDSQSSQPIERIIHIFAYRRRETKRRIKDVNIAYTAM